MRIIARHYPNNELRVVICPDVPMGKSQEQEVREPECRAIAASGPSLDIRSELKTDAVEVQEEGGPVGLRPGYGGVPRPTAFGNNGRRTILRCGGALGSIAVDPSEVAFLTGTLPGSTCAAKRALRDWSSYAVNLLKAKISKLGIHDSLSFYVWELQQRGALHLHYAIHVPCISDMHRLISEFKRIWTQVIDAVGDRSGVDVWERDWGGTWAGKKEVIKADAQVCKKSPSAYMAKYVSKEAYAPRRVARDEGEFAGPVRWWGCSRPLLKLMNSMTLSAEKVGISWHRIKYIREDLLTLLDGLTAKIKMYSDKAKTSEVVVSYDKENGIHVFNEIARLLGRSLFGERREGCDTAFNGEQERDSAQLIRTAIADDLLEVVDGKKGGNEEDCARGGGLWAIGSSGLSGEACQMALW
jgi:hypothetical protein